MQYDYYNRSRFENVTVDIDADVLNIYDIQNVTEAECNTTCTQLFRCVGFIYLPLTNICQRITDITETFDLVSVITLRNEESNDSNVVRLKEEKRCMCYNSRH